MDMAHVSLTAVARDALKHPRQVYLLKGGLVVCFDTEGSSSVGEAALVLELSRVGADPSPEEIGAMGLALVEIGYDTLSIRLEALPVVGFFHTVRLVWAGVIYEVDEDKPAVFLKKGGYTSSPIAEPRKDD